MSQDFSQKDQLLDAALAQVPFEGMNRKALEAGADAAGLSRDLIHVHFPQGGASLAAAYHRRSDAALAKALKAERPSGRFRDQIAQAVWMRLSIADRELVRAGASTLALPGNIPLGQKLVWETVDIIWDGLGDSSADVNWYSKRATLSAVYSATVLYWLGDNSEGQIDTRAFLDRRIDGVMQFEKVKAQAKKIPGMSQFTDLAFGWIRAPKSRDLPGKTTQKGADNDA